jgi:hypothetical protein
VAEGCPHLRTQYRKHPSEDQRSGKKREQRMIDFLPGIVLAEGRLGALAQEIGESSLYIPPITGFEPHVRPSPRSGAPTMWSNRAAIKPAARSSWVKSQGARPNVAGANNATPLIPGPRRIAHSPNEKTALQLHTYRLERRARVSALRPCSQGIPRLAGEDVAPRSRTPVQSPTPLRFRVICCDLSER